MKRRPDAKAQAAVNFPPSSTARGGVPKQPDTLSITAEFLCVLLQSRK